MAASPNWKVYNPSGEYVAACKHAEDAAALVALYGDGAKIKHRHGETVWHEGEEQQRAAESYDHVMLVCLERVRMPVTVLRLLGRCSICGAKKGEPCEDEHDAPMHGVVHVYGGRHNLEDAA